MADIPFGIAKNEAQSLVNFVKKEAPYLCCFNGYVENFDQKRKILAAKLKDVNTEIEKASGVSRVKHEAWQWAGEAKEIIDVDTKKKKKCFSGWCLNCWWQYGRGKELEAKTLQIDQLLGRSNFDIAAGPADVLGIKYLSLANFMHFESRKLKFQDLKEALEDENCNMIGLHGFGGTGKTSMAIQVGAELERSKFRKVIFLVVSKPPDFKKLRAVIARHLDLKLEDVKEENHWETIMSKITKMEEKLLIILDDVWDKFDLRENLGIPPRHLHKSCSVLITTRIPHVCTEMECQREIHLETLNNEEALTLFLTHASLSDSSSLKGVVQNIVKHCHGVPVVIVAVARSLRGRTPEVWKDALKTLQKAKLVLDANDDLKKVSEGLKLSYDNLKNDKSKELFLISSLFPEDFEIPLELLRKIGVGGGPFGEVDNYNERRTKVLDATMELLDSSLLLNARKGYVKMHDLVREVALLIGGKDTQSILDFEMPIKEELRYLFWKNANFLNGFAGKKLEILIIFLDCLEDLKGSQTFFTEMTRLKVLVLAGNYRLFADQSLLQSLESLKGIRALTMGNLKLGDIFTLGNLPNLETLWLRQCSVNKLPEEFLKLKKLRLLDVIQCEIEMNNPFEVIEKCSQLDELTFVDNVYDKKQKGAISQNVSSLTLHRFQISWKDISDDFERYGSLSRCFEPGDLRDLISEATFKKLVGSVELLSLLGFHEERKWRNLIPDIVPLDKQVMDDLIILNLSSWPSLKCLIDTENYNSDVIAFSNLVELHLSQMDVEDLCWGSLPSCFLEQLKIMTLEQCQKLRNMLFNGNLNLRHLMIMELRECPQLMSIFQPSTAQSLVELEELKIVSCDALEYIISYKNSGGEKVGNDGGNDQKTYDPLFTKLKTLHIAKCHKFKIILPVLSAGGLQCLQEISILDCEQLEYIFDEVQEGDHDLLPSLKEMELSNVPGLMGMFKVYHKPISSSMQRLSSQLSRNNSKEKLPRTDKQASSGWAQVCCFLHKSRATSEDTNVAVSKESLPDHTISQGLLASKQWFDTVDIAIRQVLFVCHIKRMKIANLCLDSKSLFTLSMASMIMWEELTIERCNGLKHIVKSEADYDNDHKNCISIFPKLEKLEVLHCKDLDFLIPSTGSVGIKNLKSFTIHDASELKYIVGKCLHEELHFDLPTLEVICLKDVPNFISFCVTNHYLACPSLQQVDLRNCGISSFTDLIVSLGESQLNCKTPKGLQPPQYGFPPFQAAAQSLMIYSLITIKEITLCGCPNLISFLSLPTASMVPLEKLTITECAQLKCIVADERDDVIHMNQIFPELKVLEVSACDALEHLFPVHVFRSPKHLESLKIRNARKLNYVFGRSSHHDDNIQTYIDFPALEKLHLGLVPNLTSICPENYHVIGLSLKSIYFRRSSKFNIKSITDFMVCRNARQQDSTTIRTIETHLQTLTSLDAYDSKMQEIFSLTHLEVEKNEEGQKPLTSSLRRLSLGNLSELTNICGGPKYILSFNNLSFVEISRCKKLAVIFSLSTLKSLPNLEKLYISDCEQLVHIVEEDHEENADEACFPKLGHMKVEYCNKLKYLFSITISGIFPKLSGLVIESALSLEHVLISRDEREVKALEDVLPELIGVGLYHLPRLVSVCRGVDFRTMEYLRVYDCPRFSFYETTSAQLEAGLENIDSEVPQKIKQKLSLDHSEMGEAEERQGLATQQFKIVSPSFSKGTKEATTEINEEDVVSEMPKTTISSSDSKVIGQHGAKGVTRGTNEEDLIPKVPKIVGLSDIRVETEEISSHLNMDQSDMGDTKGRTDLTAQQSTIGSPYFTEQSTIDSPIPLSHNLTALPAEDNAPMTVETFEDEEEEEEEGRNIKSDVETTNQQIHEGMDTIQLSVKSCAFAIVDVPSGSGNIVGIPHATTLPEAVLNEDINEASVVPNKYKENVAPHGDQAKSSGDVRGEPSLRTQKEQESSYSKGQIVKYHDATMSDIVDDAQSWLSPFSALIVTTPSFAKTNQGLNVPGVQEIVNLMKLDDLEFSLLAKAIETHPQLLLSSTNDRSTWMLCNSYRVLLNILNILTTRTPFTITEVDKKMLEENLKDAHFLGFDRDWLESVETKVLDCDISEVDGIQEALKGLEDDLKINEARLADICDEEVEAEREIEEVQKQLNAAQQKYANVMALHTHLLKARQDILARWHQYREIIAAKNKYIGF